MLTCGAAKACHACGGEGTYRMGCSRAVCHVCKGRGFLRAPASALPSTVAGNLPPKGGDVQMRKALLLMFGLLACSTSREGLAPSADGGAEAGGGAVPYRGHGDVAVAADAVPDAVPDAVAADAVPAVDVVTADAGRDLGTLEALGLESLSTCSLPTDAGWRGNEKCPARPGSVSELTCYVVAGSLAPKNPPCSFTASAVPVIYVTTSCEECPL
jgi:hypothetical protein